MTILALLLAQSAILSPPTPPEPKSVGVTQLSSITGPTAQVSQIPSDTSRTSVQVQRVIGRDRCEGRSHANDEVCRRALEQRASSYAPADPTPLSRDQRAIAERRVVPRSDPVTAEQRIARGELDPEASAAQNIAAATSAKQSVAGNDPADTGLTDLQRAIVSGVIVPDDVSNAAVVPK